MPASENKRSDVFLLFWTLVASIGTSKMQKNTKISEIKRDPVTPADWSGWLHKKRLNRGRDTCRHRSICRKRRRRRSAEQTIQDAGRLRKSECKLKQVYYVKGGSRNEFHRFQSCERCFADRTTELIEAEPPGRTVQPRPRINPIARFFQWQ